jgi:hypothetical protein
MKEQNQHELPFGKENYLLFGIATLIVIIGYLLMVGGASESPETFNYDGLFSPRRITVAPLMVLAGFGLGFYAIVKRPKDEVKSKEEVKA